MERLKKKQFKESFHLCNGARLWLIRVLCDVSVDPPFTNFTFKVTLENIFKGDIRVTNLRARLLGLCYVLEFSRPTSALNMKNR